MKGRGMKIEGLVKIGESTEMAGLVRTGDPMGMTDSLKATSWTPGKPGKMRPQGGEPPDKWILASMSSPSALTSKQLQRWASSDIGVTHIELDP